MFGSTYYGGTYFGSTFFGQGVSVVASQPWNARTIIQAFRTASLTSSFASVFGSRVYVVQAPPRPELPYAVLSIIDTVPFRDFDNDGGLMRVQVSMIGSDAGGPAVLGTYSSHLRKNMSRASLTVSGLDVLGVDYDVDRGPFRDGDRWRVDADYIIRFMET
jgi:hypothetical protein